jgi:hypothetical protein
VTRSTERRLSQVGPYSENLDTRRSSWQFRLASLSARTTQTHRMSFPICRWNSWRRRLEKK